jgi:hypothetical protein
MQRGVVVWCCGAGLMQFLSAIHACGFHLTQGEREQLEQR